MLSDTTEFGVDAFGLLVCRVVSTLLKNEPFKSTSLSFCYFFFQMYLYPNTNTTYASDMLKDCFGCTWSGEIWTVLWKHIPVGSAMMYVWSLFSARWLVMFQSYTTFFQVGSLKFFCTNKFVDDCFVCVNLYEGWYFGFCNENRVVILAPE